MPNRKLAALTATALALLVLACGSGGSTQVNITPGAAAPAATAVPAAAPATIGKVGDRIEANGIALTVVKTEQKGELSQIQKAKDGNVFLVAEVVIENVSVDKAPYNPLYFKVKDADGFEYNAEFSGGDQALKSGDLTKGDKARGTVAFEVKKAAKGLVLSYKPIVLFSGDEAIRVALD